MFGCVCGCCPIAPFCIISLKKEKNSDPVSLAEYLFEITENVSASNTTCGNCSDFLLMYVSFVITKTEKEKCQKSHFSPAAH
jgi:hypothetical protein